MKKEDLDNLIMVARSKKLWLKNEASGVSLSPMELHTLLNQSEEYYNYEFELFDPQSLINEFLVKITVLDTERDKIINKIKELDSSRNKIIDRIKHASDDDQSAATPYLKVKDRYCWFKRMIYNFDPKSNCEEDRQWFMWGSAVNEIAK